ncbi:MAG: S8 family serine peptidase [Chloroflexi bacterium]|nr:S8 family serine peptidase [Chloroflexota bacterium]
MIHKKMLTAGLLTVLVAVLSLASAGVAVAQDALLAKAREQGTVAVIVGLRMTYSPMGELSGAQAADQMARIQTARRSLVTQLGSQAVVKADSFNWLIPFVAMQVTAEGVQQLRASPLVFSVQEDRILKRTLVQSTRVIHADEAWDWGYDGEGWAVAVLDTGVDATHPMLSGGKVVAEACFSSNIASSPIGPSQEICSTVASAAAGQITATGPGASSPNDCIAKVTGDDSGCSHGTHVSGIAAGNGSVGGTLYQGVARAARLIGVQVFSYFTSANDVYTWTSDQISALNWVYVNRDGFAVPVAAVNMSIGGEFYNNQTTCDTVYAATKAAIDNLRSVGIATVIASGNDGFTTGIGAPGCVSTAIAVGATDKFDVPATFSNSQAMLDLYAPGVFICSSVVGGTSCWDGTSMATPHVAGAWAVLKDAYDDTWSGGNATVEAVYRALKDTGRLVTRAGVTRPRIDVGRAARLIAGQITLSSAAAVPIPSRFFTREVTLTWTYLSWASRYEIQVDNTSTFTSPEYATTVPGGSGVPFPSARTGSLSDGTYYWRVRGITATGTFGAWSPASTFVVEAQRNAYP